MKDQKARAEGFLKELMYEHAPEFNKTVNLLVKYEAFLGSLVTQYEKQIQELNELLASEQNHP